MRLGERLLQSGQLTATQLEQGLRTQRALSGRLGTNLIELGFVFADAVSKALAQQKGVPAARRKHFDAADPNVRKLVPKHLAERLGVIPLAMATRFGRELVVAFQDPDDIEAVDEVSRYAGVKVRPSVATEFYIIEYLEKLYGVAPRRLLRTNQAGRSQPTAAFDGGSAETGLPTVESQFDLNLPASLAAGLAPARFGTGAPSGRHAAATSGRHPTQQPQRHDSAADLDLGQASSRHAATLSAERNSAQRRRLATAELDAGWDSIGQFTLDDEDSLGARAATGPERTPPATSGWHAATPAPEVPPAASAWNAATTAPQASSPPGLGAALEPFPTTKQPQAFDPFPETKPSEAFSSLPAPLEPVPIATPPDPTASPGSDEAQADGGVGSGLQSPLDTGAAPQDQEPFSAGPEASDSHGPVETVAPGGDGATLEFGETRPSVPLANAPLSLTADEAFSAIERAVDREQVADALIDYLRNASAGLVLVCRQGIALGWRGHAPEADTAALEALSIPLSVPSMFEFAYRQGTLFRGPPPQAGATIQDRLWKLMHCEAPEEVLVCPVTIGGRVVNLLYAHGDDGLSVELANELTSLANAAAASYVQLIKARRRH